jgi:hypothetical protein
VIKHSLTALLIAAALPALADPLPDMAGAWTGSGWARQTPGAPKEAVRCRLNNTYDAAARRLEIEGQCAVPGKRLKISGALIERDAGRVGGYWSNPDGPGRTQISGQTQGDAVYFTFRATEPGTGRDLSQIITWRAAEGALSLRAVTRPDRQEMSVIDFTR